MHIRSSGAASVLGNSEEGWEGGGQGAGAKAELRAGLFS